MKKTFFAALLLVATIGASAQRLSGNVSPLKNQGQVNVVLDFSQTTVHGKPEEVFIAEELSKRDDAQTQAFLREWRESLRNDAYNMLLSGLNKHVANAGFQGGNFPDAEYTMCFRIIDINKGFFAGVMNKASAILAEVDFIKTGETVPFATIKLKKASHALSANVPYYVTRTAMSFDTVGAMTGKLLNKRLR